MVRGGGDAAGERPPAADRDEVLVPGAAEHVGERRGGRRVVVCGVEIDAHAADARVLDRHRPGEAADRRLRRIDHRAAHGVRARADDPRGGVRGRARRRETASSAASASTCRATVSAPVAGGRQPQPADVDEVVGALVGERASSSACPAPAT